MNTIEFKKKLKEYTDKDQSLRPFICNGNPLDSEIFIVGINPATNMTNPFWKYYKGEEFNKRKWLDDYIESRMEKRTKISLTRSKIEKLVQGKFKTYQCLETNVYSKPSNVLRNLAEKDRNTDIFNFLIRSIRPKAIIIHGKMPFEFIKNELNARFRLGEPVMSGYEMKNTISPLEFEWEFGKIAICATKHFRLIAIAEIENAADGLLKIIRK